MSTTSEAGRIAYAPLRPSRFETPRGPGSKKRSVTGYLIKDTTATTAKREFAKIDRFIGTDLSVGFDYRPLLSENISIVAGVSGLIPGQGFRDIYNNSFDCVQPLVGELFVCEFCLLKNVKIMFRAFLILKDCGSDCGRFGMAARTLDR